MRWFKLSLVVVFALAIAAFVVQNMSRTTVLSFDTGVWAWQLSSPVAVPLVMGACLLLGHALAWFNGWRRNQELSRRVRQLEQELALRSTASAPAKDGWA